VFGRRVLPEQIKEAKNGECYVMSNLMIDTVLLLLGCIIQGACIGLIMCPDGRGI
jgi:hypothetical protein